MLTMRSDLRSCVSAGSILFIFLLQFSFIFIDIQHLILHHRNMMQQSRENVCLRGNYVRYLLPLLQCSKLSLMRIKINFDFDKPVSQPRGVVKSENFWRATG